MPVDPWATTVAQEFPTQEPDTLRRLWGIIAAQKRAMFDLRASVLANVSDIVADLRAQVAAVAAASAAAAAAAAAAATAAGVAAAAAAAATAAVADLASRVTVTATIGSFNTPSLPGDSAWHDYGADIPITIAVPTGKLVVTVGCGEAYINSNGGTRNAAQATFSISGGYANYGDVYAEEDGPAPAIVFSGATLCVQRAFTVPPGTYTITGKMRAQSTGTGSIVQFNNPYLTVQVTG